VFTTIHPAFTDSTYSKGKFWHGHTGRVAPSTVDSDILCIIHLESPAFDLKNVSNTITQTLSSADATVSSASVDGATAFTLQLDEVDGDFVGVNCPNIEVPVLSEELGGVLLPL
jgi:hypothetical protein